VFAVEISDEFFLGLDILHVCGAFMVVGHQMLRLRGLHSFLVTHKEERTSLLTQTGVMLELEEYCHKYRMARSLLQ
jgi:nucleoid DNA-binding protein